MAMDKPSTRLHGIVAAKARTAVVFRRGPTKQVRLLLWDERVSSRLPTGKFALPREKPWSRAGRPVVPCQEMLLADHYFAYGADMDVATLRAQAGGGEVVESAQLHGYRLAFFGHDPVWDSGKETLVIDAEATTWGILYRLRGAEWNRLDVCVGANLEGSGSYFHYPVDVLTPAGERRLVRTYRKAVHGESSLPSFEYLSFLVRAAAFHHLPFEYQKLLRALPSAHARYRVPRETEDRRHHLPVL
jgi:hypothetical protein